MKRTLKVHMRVIAMTLCIVTLLFCLNLGVFADAESSDIPGIADSDDKQENNAGTEPDGANNVATKPYSGTGGNDQSYILKCANRGA